MAYTLNNEFFDKLKYSEYHNYLKSLRQFGTGLTRDQLANLTGLSVHTLRRYESQWKSTKIPQWYELLLRLISGDLSYFGSHWQNVRIYPHNQRISLPEAKYKAFLPMELNQRYNRMIQQVNLEKTELRAMNKQLGIDNDVLRTDNAALMLKIEQLQKRLDQLESHQKGIDSGKVLPFRKVR